MNQVKHRCSVDLESSDMGGCSEGDTFEFEHQKDVRQVRIENAEEISLKEGPREESNASLVES